MVFHYYKNRRRMELTDIISLLMILWSIRHITGGVDTIAVVTHKGDDHAERMGKSYVKRELIMIEYLYTLEYNT